MTELDQSTHTPDQQLRYRARKISKFVYGFFIYLVVNIFLFWLDYSDNQRIDWAYWVLIGWGLGVALQGFALLVKPGLEDMIYRNISKK
jgi:2TM domain